MNNNDSHLVVGCNIAEIRPCWRRRVLFQTRFKPHRKYLDPQIISKEKVRWFSVIRVCSRVVYKMK
jgi:hypothetical protein